MSLNTEFPLWHMIMAMIPVSWALITLYFDHKALAKEYEKAAKLADEKLKEKTEALATSIKEKTEALEKAFKEKTENLASKTKELEDNMSLVKDYHELEVRKIQQSVGEINLHLKTFTSKLEMLLEGRINIEKQVNK